MEYEVRVEYMGVMRLQLKKKAEVFRFRCQPTVETLVTAISQQYGVQTGKECQKQIFVLYPAGEVGGRMPSIQELLPNNSLIRIVSMVTGG